MVTEALHPRISHAQLNHLYRDYLLRSVVLSVSVIFNANWGNYSFLTAISLANAILVIKLFNVSADLTVSPILFTLFYTFTVAIILHTVGVRKFVSIRNTLIYPSYI